MKYAFIKENKSLFSVELCCKLFGVSRSGYYGWLNRNPSQCKLSNDCLDQKIQCVYAEHQHRASSPRITEDLRAEGETCSENRVARRMKALGLRTLAKRKHNRPAILLTSTHKKAGYILRWLLTYIRER